MLLARVVGTVVATRKDARLVSNKLLGVRGVDPRGKAEGNYLVAVDTVGSGEDELVLVATGSAARRTAATADGPTDAAIIGVLDSIEMFHDVAFRKT